MTSIPDVPKIATELLSQSEKSIALKSQKLEVAEHKKNCADEYLLSFKSKMSEFRKNNDEHTLIIRAIKQRREELRYLNRAKLITENRIKALEKPRFGFNSPKSKLIILKNLSGQLDNSIEIIKDDLEALNKLFSTDDESPHFRLAQLKCMPKPLTSAQTLQHEQLSKTILTLENDISAKKLKMAQLLSKETPLNSAEKLEIEDIKQQVHAFNSSRMYAQESIELFGNRLSAVSNKRMSMFRVKEIADQKELESRKHVSAWFESEYIPNQLAHFKSN